MSDYFLNKIYDSLLSNKPVPKKPEPIVRKKEKVRTLTESYQLVKERSKASIVKDIINVAPELKPGAGKKGEVRLQPVVKEFTLEDFTAAIQLVGLRIEKVALPGDSDSKSTKFPTYVVKDEQGVEHYLVLGGGVAGNKGMTLERTLVDTLRNNLQSQERVPFYIQFKQVVGPVNFVEVQDGFKQVVRRQLTGTPQNAGKIIADIILIDDKGKEFYISLKDKNGKTISNNTLKQMFTLQGDKIIVKDVPLIDPLLTATKLDKNKIADLVEKYIKKELSGQKELELVTDFDEQIIKQYLASAFDYGYYYVRNLGKERYEIVSLLTVDDVYNMIGSIKQVAVKYPFYAGGGMQQKRKHASIIVYTDKHTFSFDLRNASAGVIPQQINLVKLK
jgi:hypothetical protein